MKNAPTGRLTAFCAPNPAIRSSAVALPASSGIRRDSFLVAENIYGSRARREPEIAEASGGPSPWRTSGPVLTTGPDVAVRVRSAMTAEEFAPRCGSSSAG